MMTMELGVQRDQQDRFKEIQEYMSAEFTKRYGNTRHPKRLKGLLRSALEAELVPVAHSVGQQLNEPMVVLKTLGNGHCLEAAISWILYKTAGMAKELVRVLLELYRDPELADLFQLGLATCQAQGGDLQHVTQESFLAGLKEGSIWSDHPEVRMLGMALNATMVVWQMDEALGMATPTCASEGSYTIHLILQGQHYEALLSRALAVECVSAQDCVPMTPFYTTDGVEQVKQAHAAARAQLERHRAQLNVKQTWDKPPPRDGNPTAELELTEEDVQPTGFLNVDVEVQTALFNSFTPLTGTEAPRTKPVKVQQKTDQGFLGSGGTQLAGASTTTVSSLKATQGSMPWSKQMSSQKSTAQSRTRGGLRGVV